MALEFKRNKLNVKDGTGTFVEIPVLGEQETEKATAGELAIEVSRATAAEDALAEQVSRLQKVVGSPFVANTAASMTNTDRVYVYTGSESGYTAGNWYYYDGSAWVSGGVYNSAGMNTDTTLAMAGIPADAEATGEAVAELSRQLSDLEDTVTDSTTGLDTKAPVILETASGAIASFSDGADSMPIKKLVAQIEPVQDLHGYSNPWPAGGGANRWDEEWEDGNIDANGNKVTATTLIRSKNYIQVEPNTTYCTNVFRVFEYDESKHFLLRTQVANDFTKTEVFTTQSTTRYLLFVMATSYGTTYNNNIAINYPSTVTTYSPYSNICPISGWTGAEIEQTGVNVWDEEWRIGYYTSTGEYSRVDNCIANVNPISVKPNTRYYLYMDSRYVNSARVVYRDLNRNFISAVSLGNVFAFTTPNNCYFIDFGTFTAPAVTAYNNDISINYPATDTTYHPYTGNQISVNWEDEAGTIYGGTVTLNEDGSADVISRYQLKALNGSETPQGGYAVNANTVSRYFTILPRTPINNPASISEEGYMPFLKSNLFQVKSRSVWGSAAENNVWCWTINNYDQLHLAFSNNALGITTESSSAEVDAAVKAWLANNPCYFTLPLTEENYQTYHFDNIGQLYTFLGTNNVWCDTGDVEVTYPADTKLFIEKLTQPTEDDMTANANIAANTFFMIGNTLYFSTAAIAQGATIIPGTNCNVVSLADALNQLNT